ncbi:sugar phosphate nucleotidyltransferase [Desulfonema magnum]|uniref:Transferase domain-containing protein n=1 Tax=Desulfonema magnum TaxID=45655 RepID=A0A975GP63_9BACT|nr:sugar phosphate nucleotidyltransferase [Desulfonema magnum]QTA88691.1 Transferase domain-containing protein [Desulfonema magnum]
MKAMILAAGFGTRLLPFTETLPKPLFPFAGRPLLDIIIRSLQDAGCEVAIVNTHHLHEKIDDFISGQNYKIPVQTRYEPMILGTGGGIKNVADFWDDQPFMVINSDIVTNIDLREVYEFHLNHTHPVTMVLHDDSEFNTVIADEDNFIKGFRVQEIKDFSDSRFPVFQKLAFTGIQVIDPEILDLIPAGVFSGSIDAYRKLISEGKKIKAFISSEQYDWQDVGDLERFRNAVIEKMAAKAFKTGNLKLETGNSQPEISYVQLKGDGSDRKWFRLTRDNQSLVMVDHGIRKQGETSETDSFINIGHHLRGKGIPVPEIRLYDMFSGLVFLEDLGDVHLQTVVRDAETTEEIISYYQSVIDILVRMSVFGGRDFDLSRTYQTAYYDRELILEKECRYFVDAFLKGYLGTNSCFEDFEDEFSALADRAIEFSVTGFMHRDMQSRNIMVRSCSDSQKRNEFYLIDFQGGRIGPIQYDLASLLIDPYVELPCSVQADLSEYCIKKLSSFIRVDPGRFRTGYKYCSVARNLQMLGAFGYLSRVKGKTYFEKYIPVAVNTLKYNLSRFGNADFPKLKEISKICAKGSDNVKGTRNKRS